MFCSSVWASGDETDVVIDKRGITLKNPLKPEYQIRQTHNVITFTDDNWNTTRTAISNGHIIADVIVGRLLVGQSLQITATKADGTTLTFKVNGEGVFISNGSLVIEPLNTEDESNGVEIHPGKGKGLIITHKDNKFRVVLNADRGLVFQRQEIGSGDWTKVDEPVFIDTKGNAVLGGDIHARRLYLQEIGGENILTYMDSRNKSQFEDNNNIYTSGDKEGETKVEPTYKLSGNYIEGRGLKAYDENNNLRVHIDGSDGSLKMYNGYIEMQNVVTDSSGRVLKDSKGNDLYNKLYIDPENFIRWIIKNEPKFYYDTDTNALVFGGTIKTSEDAEIGNNLYVGTDGVNEPKKIQFQQSALIETYVDHTGYPPSAIRISASSLQLPEKVYAGKTTGAGDSNKVATYGWVMQHLSDFKYVTEEQLNATIAQYFPSNPHTPGGSGGGDSGGDSGDSGGGTTTGSSS